MENRIRKEKKYIRYIRTIMYIWQKSHISYFDEYDINDFIHSLCEENKINEEKFRIDIYDIMVNTLKTKYENLLNKKSIKIEEIEIDIQKNAIIYDVEIRLLSYLNIWERQYPNAIKKTELQKIVNDTQNVHTRLINSQTSKSMKIFNDVEVPKGQKTIDEIIDVWITFGKTWEEIKSVYKDMDYWGREYSIYSEGDYLYRKTLRSLWALIKTYKNKSQIETYNELVKRLFEECTESLEMCAQGHITRLANVMVGFHEGFLSPKSIKEEFQDQMAEISSNTITTEKEKIEQAIIIMNSINMPKEERQVWLDAF